MVRLERDECERILERHAYGRLACFSPSNNETYIVPVSYTYHDGSLYFASIQGQKLRYLREHPDGVAIEVDEIDDEQDWFTVIATGRYEELEGAESTAEEADALRRAEHGPLRFFFEPDSLAEGVVGPLVLSALRIGKLTGRKDRWSWGVDFPRQLRQPQHG